MLNCDNIELNADELIQALTDVRDHVTGRRKLYQETRPEIFQLRGDGQRDFSMLCYGNPATQKTYLEQIGLQLAATASRTRRTASTSASTPATRASATIRTPSAACPSWNGKPGRSHEIGSVRIVPPPYGEAIASSAIA